MATVERIIPARPALRSQEGAAPDPAPRTLLARFAGLCLAVRVVLEVVGGRSAHAHGRSWRGDFWNLWNHWDAPHYLRIAEIGYTSHPNAGHDQFLIGFFPAYPLAVRAAHLLTGDYLVAGLLVSYAASVGACWFLYRLVRLRADHATAWRAVVLMLAFPTAYVLALPYTEALFLCAVLASVWFARTGRFAAAGVAGAFASGTRVVGFALWPVLAIEAWRRGETPGERLRNLAWSAVSGLGLAAFLMVNQVVYGTPTQFVTAQKDNWDQGTAWPWKPLIDAWRSYGNAQGDLKFIMWTRLAAFAVTAAVLLVGTRRMAVGDLIYGWTTFIFVLSSVWLLSLPRYVLVIYPLFVIGADLTRRRGLFAPVVAGCAVIQGWWFWRYAGGSDWAF